MSVTWIVWIVAIAALVATTMVDLYCSRPMFRLAVGFCLAVWLACIAVAVLR